MKVVLLISLFFLSLNSTAQDAWMDSIKMELSKSKADTNRVKLYLAIQKYNMNTDYEITKVYNQKSMALAKKLRFDFGLAKSYYNKGEIDFNFGEYTSLLENAQ